MKVVLDESVRRALDFDLDGHHVRTAQSQGFSTLSNGMPMQAMLDEGFWRKLQQHFQVASRIGADFRN